MLVSRRIFVVGADLQNRSSSSPYDSKLEQPSAPAFRMLQILARSRAIFAIGSRQFSMERLFCISVQVRGPQIRNLDTRMQHMSAMAPAQYLLEFDGFEPKSRCATACSSPSSGSMGCKSNEPSVFRATEYHPYAKRHSLPISKLFVL